jgi:hypothetical protein
MVLAICTGIYLIVLGIWLFNLKEDSYEECEVYEDEEEV